MKPVLAMLPALLVASLAIAQTSPPTDTSTPTAAQQNQKDPNDPSKGQDLVSDKEPTPQSAVKSPTTVGHDKQSGNNLVGDNTGQMQNSTGTQPPFQTLDTQKHGYLMAKDVSQHAWLKQNFTKCDADNDGHLTQPEYSACTMTKQ